MHLEAGCHAAWYELNISSADDCVSACCYYSGEKDRWLDEVVPVDRYWNSERIKAIRRINSPGGGNLVGGCEGCYFFGHRGETGLYYPSFFTESPDWTLEQRENWQLAVDDFNAGREEVRASPMRFYINFGFACNLSCVMCHQVPRRGSVKRQVSAATVLAWKQEMKRAIEITVIGGEPFVLIEALTFMRAIIEDPDFDNVQLTICTNGTLHHKFMDLLRIKRKLALVVSLDSIGAEYEAIRVGSSWRQVENNITSFLETGRELGFPWTVQSPCMVLATNIPRLEDYAKWCIEHEIQPGFYDFVNARGIEATFEHENVIAHPQLLLAIPDWAMHFERAIAVLQRARFSFATAQLETLYAQAQHNLSAWSERQRDVASVLDANSWSSLLELAGPSLPDRLERNFYEPAGSLEFDPEHRAAMLRAGSLNDHVSTPFVPIRASAGPWLRVTCEWLPDSVGERARSYVQDDGFHSLVETQRTEVGLVESRVFRLQGESNRLRVVFSGTAGSVAVLPTRMTIDQPSGERDLIDPDLIQVDMAPVAEAPAPHGAPATSLSLVARARRNLTRRVHR